MQQHEVGVAKETKDGSPALGHIWTATDETATDLEGTKFTKVTCDRCYEEGWRNEKTGEIGKTKEEAGWVDHNFTVTYSWSGSGTSASGWSCTATRYCSTAIRRTDTPVLNADGCCESGTLDPENTILG